MKINFYDISEKDLIRITKVKSIDEIVKGIRRLHNLINKECSIKALDNIKLKDLEGKKREMNKILKGKRDEAKKQAPKVKRTRESTIKLGPLSFKRSDLSPEQLEEIKELKGKSKIIMTELNKAIFG